MKIKRSIWAFCLTSLIVGGTAVAKHFDFFLEESAKNQQEQKSRVSSSNSLDKNGNKVTNCSEFSDGAFCANDIGEIHEINIDKSQETNTEINDKKTTIEPGGTQINCSGVIKDRSICVNNGNQINY